MKKVSFPISVWRDAHRTRGIEPLESRIAPALTNPFSLATVDGANGFHLSGLGASGFGERPAAVAGDVNGDGFDDVIFGATGLNAAFVVFGKADGFPADLNLTTLNGTNGFRIDGTAASRQFGQAVSAAGDVNGDGFADIVVGAFNETIDGKAQAGAAYVIFGKASFGATFSIAVLDGTNGFKVSGVAKDDQTGSDVGAAGDLNGDGFDDVVISALGADPNGSSSGSAFVVFGKATGFEPNIVFGSFFDGLRINGAAASDFFGTSPSAAGDVNSDGLGDLIVGAQGANANGSDSGAAYVIFGRTNFPSPLEVSTLNGTNGFRLRGGAAGDTAGFSVSGGGDVNGDGLADVVVGALSAKSNGTNSGAAYVVFGKATPFAASLTLSALNGSDGFRVVAEEANALTGYSVQLAGDVNGDGFDDVIVSAPGSFQRASNATSYVIYGRAAFTASIALASLDGATGVKFLRAQANDSSGSNVATGDINGDGLDDVISSDFFGGHVVFGSPSPAVTQLGTTVPNTLAGDGAANILIGGAAGDTLLGNGGADVLRGGQGDDVLAIADADFRRLAGGLGVDTLRFDGAGFGLDLTALGATLVTGVERIDLTTGGNFLALNYRDVQHLSTTTNTLTILGGADDFVDFGAGWLAAGTEVIDGTSYRVLLQRGARLNIADTIATTRPAGTAAEGFDGTGGFTLIGETEFDAIGRTVSVLGDVNGDGFDDVIIGAYRANPLGVQSGAAYVVFGTASGLPSELDLATLNGTNGFRIRGTNQNSNGFSTELGSAGDVNGDGFADILIGEPGFDTPADAGGAAYVIFGRATFTADLTVTTLNGTNGGFRITGTTAFEAVGSAVGGGDINGDGYDDVLIGAAGNDAGGKDAGAVFVVFGKAGGFANLTIAQIDGTNGFRIAGEAAGDRLGTSVAAGDVNGDGFADIITGAYGAKVNGAGSGSAYVIFGKAAGFGAGLNVSTLNGTNGFEMRGAAGDAAGFSVGTAGDVNGDGFADVIVGAFGADPDETNSGAAYVVFGRANGFSPALNLAALNGTSGFRVTGSGSFSNLGYSVGTAGDFNGDGFDDLLVSASLASGPQEAYVIFGHAGGFAASIRSLDIDGSNGVKLTALEGVGRSPSASGGADVNGDGFDDVILGSWLTTALGRDQAGETHVFFGGDTGAVTLPGDAGANTLTGSAFPDVIVAGQGNDTLLGNGGADAARGGQGDDLFAIGDLTFARLNGGTGTDTLRFDGAGFALNLTTLSDTKLQGFERIDLTGSGANTLTLSVREVLNFSPTSNTLTVLGDAGDFVTIGAGWIKELNATIGPTEFEVFTSGAATLRIAVGVAHSLPSGYALTTFNGTTGFTIEGAAADDRAVQVAGAGDVNGDGFDDFLVAARNADPNGLNSGAAYVIFGKAAGFTSPVNLGTLNGTDGFTLRGEAANFFTGYSIHAAGDFNGDGFADIALDSAATTGANQSGTAYVVFGHGGSFAPAFELSSLDGTNGFKIRATAKSVIGGVIVNSAGDVNGDGYADLVLGAPSVTPGSLTQTGAAYVVFGRATSPGASFDLASLNGANGFALAGTKQFELLGQYVSGGDVNGDGFSDVIVGTAGSAPATFVVFGKAAGFAAQMLDTAINGTNGFTLTGAAAQSVSAAGDVNGDGLGDLIVGAPNATPNGKSSGAAYVVFGKAGATIGKTVDLAALTGTNGFQIAGRLSQGYLGQTVSAAGDMNGDGFDDVIVGAAFLNTRGLQTGEAYVIYGAPSFAPSLNVGALDGTNGFALIGTDLAARAGRPVSGAGDVNGDGFDDVLVGSYGTLSGTEAAGRNYLIFGFDNGKVTQRGDANANTLAGTAGRDVIVAGQGNDTVTNAGTSDVLRGGQGDDNFSLVSGPLGRLVGGHGFDTLTLNGGLLLDLTARPVYRITGFEQVDLRPGANSLSLDARAVVNASPDTNTLIVRTDIGDVVNIGSGWNTNPVKEIIDGDEFTVFTQGAATLKVSTEIAPIVTLVNATTATYRDVDGDLVTIKTSKGTLGISDFFLVSAGTVGGAQLTALNFADDGTEFQNSDLTITAARSTLGGDGRVNVGRIDATDVDLAKVTVEGDLGRFNAGDATLTTEGVEALSVGSLGVFGTSTQGVGGIVEFTVRGELGTLTVQSDIYNARINVFAPFGGLGLGAVSIGGSIIADSAAITGFFTDGSTGAIKIGGDVRGGPNGAGAILSFDIAGNIGGLNVGGSLAAGVNTGIGAINAGGTFGPITIGGDLDHTKLAAVKGFAGLTVGGSVLSSRVLAGYDLFEIPTNADATIGAVKVDGDWVASNLVAGVVSSDPFFGNGGETLIVSGSPAVAGGDPAKIAKIASITIVGEVIGTPGGTDHFGFVAEEIGSFSVGGTKFPLLKGAANDTSGLRVGSTLDVKVREVKVLGIFEQPPAVEGPAGAPAFSLGALDGDNGFRFDGLTQGSTLGFVVSTAGDVNGDGFDDLIIAAKGAKVAGQVNLGEAYVIFGTDKGLPAAFDPKALNGKNGFRIQADLGNDRSYFALAVGDAGDVNNDGFDDVIVGGLADGGGFTGTTEKAFVIFGKASFTTVVKANTLGGIGGFEITHPFAPDPNFGTYIRMSVDGAGDLNGDGFDDVVIGAVNADFGTQNSGSAYVVFSPGLAKPASIDTSTLNGTTGFRLDGPNAFANLGYSVSRAGDVNGDGFADLIVGATRATVAGAASGSGYVVFGKNTPFAASFGVGALTGPNGFRIPAIDNRGDTGNTVSGGGDVNGDGIDDIVIGVPYAGPNFTYPGASYVIFGKRTAVVGNFPADFDLATLTGPNGFKITGESDYDYAGRVVIAGDINGDGLADIAVGAIGIEAHNEFRGGAYVVFGKAAPLANVLLSSLDGLNGVKLLGARAGDQAGLGISGAGDFDGDGKADLLVGASTAEAQGTFTGAAFFVSGASLVYGVNISTDGKTASFTDVDGDRVTIKTSAGGFVASDFTFKAAGSSGGIQLQSLDLSSPAHAAFAGANLTVTAVRGPTGGDGFVNIGAIKAADTDLGKIMLDGDLGQLAAGDGDPLKPAVAALNVHSLGLLGLSTQVPTVASLRSKILGKLGAFTVKSDIVGAFLNIAGSANDGDDDSGAITIGGSLRGGALANSGSIFAAGDLGAVKIGGSVLGGVGLHSGSVEAGAKIASISLGDSLLGGTGAASGSIIAGTTLGAVKIGGDVNGGRIFAQGNVLPTSTALALAIKSLNVTGSVSRADIFAGYDLNGAAVNADVQIGAVSVGRDWTESDLVAGLRPIDAHYGNGDELIPGGNAVASRIASIVIKGQVLGTPTAVSGTDHFGFVAEEIGAFAIGGTVFKLTPGGPNDLAGLPVGATGDVRVREVQ